MSRKLFFLVGSVIGSTLGLLFARESGRDLRSKLNKAKTPQKKFEVLFQEYLSAGEAAVKEISDSDMAREVVAGGREIIAELQKRGRREGGQALRFAQEKALELIEQAEQQFDLVEKKAAAKAKSARKTVKKTAAKTRKVVAEKAAKTVKTAKKTVRRATKKIQK